MKTYQSHLSISLYKVENKKEKIADFKTAISSTVKSLSNSEKIEVSVISRKSLFSQGYLTAISNPKGWAFMSGEIYMKNVEKT